MTYAPPRPLAATLLCIALLLPWSVQAAVKLPAAISSHMVVQREKPVPIWGMADPGEAVTVEFNGQSVETKAGPDGKWMVKLGPMQAGGPFPMKVVGTNSLELEDILIGEVWFCGGQSNMAFPLQNVPNSAEVLAAANHPNIRIFNTKRTIADTPQFTVSGSWQPFTPASAKASPAVAYFFALQLQEELGVPIGLLHSSWGGTGAEVWMPEDLLNREFPPIMESWAQILADFPAAQRAAKAATAQAKEAHKREVELAKAAGKKPPTAPRKLTPKGGKDSRDTPAGGWNGMITPHVPYAVRGVIWYQGEANAGRGYQYRKLFPALIGAWRAAWAEPELPFLFVQLPNMERKTPPSPPDWAEVREAQLMTAKSVPHTGMVVAIDVGDPKDLHPKDKKPVGDRLARLAAGMVYGKGEGDFTGPLFAASEAVGPKVKITFTSAESGLVAKDGAELSGFTIAGADKRFVPATAVIEGGAVVVSSPHVAAPSAVRYGWLDNPPSTLYNKSGLPASPFRTDDWPERTFDNERILQTKAISDAMAGAATEPEADAE